MPHAHPTARRRPCFPVRALDDIEYLVKESEVVTGQAGRAFVIAGADRLIYRVHWHPLGFKVERLDVHGDRSWTAGTCFPWEFRAPRPGPGPGLRPAVHCIGVPRHRAAAPDFRYSPAGHPAGDGALASQEISMKIQIRIKQEGILRPERGAFADRPTPVTDLVKNTRQAGARPITAGHHAEKRKQEGDRHAER
jgi:hypothetical protein